MDFKKLVEIMSALRAENGCPWDKEQTRASLRPFLLEETYELLEALDEDNPEKIKEELGDILLQIVFHSQIAKEKKEFDIYDVVKTISDKMIKRHPHVFAGIQFKSKAEHQRHWEEEKKREGKKRESVLEGVPKALPSLLRAHKLQKKAARAGFDWEKTDDVIKKLDEELNEFKTALNNNRQSEIEDELGDIFFVLVNISRFVGVNPEDALRKTISKFISRFRYIEMKASESERNLSDMALEEMDALWDEAKTKSRNKTD
ncbi:MAG: nucleoside triphosphate pyrophosphohydrolase [Nitrospiraceae bacterium]|nr:nucleoside triphosphate pyrophosphohydrolase [Nitrospiraceae bacterium]